jgi:hypothetical protein
MRANSLSEANAFSEGSPLWIIENDSSLVWWKKIDLGSKYLLSQNLLRPDLRANIRPNKLNSIPFININSNHLLLGSEDHFLSKWILLWKDLDQTELIDLIENTYLSLHVTAIRFFSESKIISKLETRPSASLISMSYIENT